MFDIDPHHPFSEYTRKRFYLLSDNPELEYRPEISLGELVLFRYVGERFLEPVNSYSW